MTNENNTEEDPIDVLVDCSMQDLAILDYIFDDSDADYKNNFKSKIEDEDASNLSFDADDLREWIEEDGDDDNEHLTDFEPIQVVSSKADQASDSDNDTPANKAIKNHPFRNKLIESLKKLESSMRKTELSRRQILRHKNQTRAMMSAMKLHKRRSLSIKSDQTRRRLSDFAPQVTHSEYRKRSSLTYKLEDPTSFKKRSSLTCDYEDSRQRLSFLIGNSSPKGFNALTA